MTEKNNSDFSSSSAHVNPYIISRKTFGGGGSLTSLESGGAYSAPPDCRDVNEARSVRGRGQGHKVEAKAEAEAKCYEAEAECFEAEAEAEARVD